MWQNMEKDNRGTFNKATTAGERSNESMVEDGGGGWGGLGSEVF